MVAALAACSTPHETTRQDVVGRFVMTKGGFNEWLTLELNADGSYGLDHAMFACVIGPNGEMPIHHGREEGIWRIEQGIVALEPRARSKDFMDAPVFVAVHVQRLAFRRAAGHRTLVHATAPEFLTLSESTEYSFPFYRRHEISKGSEPASTNDASR
ncbi:MAG: hypothetical protein RLZZ15_2711 [Verrucomicrobiota bacterium]|jgi:hypothetical protein